MASIFDTPEEKRVEITQQNLASLGFRDSGTITPYYSFRVKEYHPVLGYVYEDYVAVYFDWIGRNLHASLLTYRLTHNFEDTIRIKNPELRDVHMALQALKNKGII